jgi:hypothetical protein
MNTNKYVTRTIGIFVGLTAAGISVILSAQAVADVFAHTVMVAIGSAIFGAGLTFFLIRITALEEK